MKHWKKKLLGLSESLAGISASTDKTPIAPDSTQAKKIREEAIAEFLKRHPELDPLSTNPGHYDRGKRTGILVEHADYGIADVTVGSQDPGKAITFWEVRFHGKLKGQMATSDGTQSSQPESSYNSAVTSVQRQILEAWRPMLTDMPVYKNYFRDMGYKKKLHIPSKRFKEGMDLDGEEAKYARTLYIKKFIDRLGFNIIGYSTQPLGEKNLVSVAAMHPQYGVMDFRIKTMPGDKNPMESKSQWVRILGKNGYFTIQRVGDNLRQAWSLLQKGIFLMMKKKGYIPLRSDDVQRVKRLKAIHGIR